MSERNEKVIDKVREIVAELSAIQSKLEALQSLTSYCGPAIDAEQHVRHALKHLELQVR